MKGMDSQREYVSLRERVAYETYAALNGGGSLGFAPSRRIAEYLRWTDAALAALGLDDRDALVQRGAEFVRQSRGGRLLTHTDVLMAAGVLDAALLATGPTSVGASAEDPTEPPVELERHTDQEDFDARR